MCESWFCGLWRSEIGPLWCGGLIARFLAGSFVIVVVTILFDSYCGRDGGYDAENVDFESERASFRAGVVCCNRGLFGGVVAPDSNFPGVS